MTLQNILQEFQKWAPFAYQESYDNSGLLVGTPQQTINKALITLDITEEIIKEAIEGGFNLIISHHPIIFNGLKSLTGRSMEERVVMSAIKNDIAIIAMHTNLDNVIHGVNAILAQRIGIKNTRILKPSSDILKKLSVFVPKNHLSVVRQAIFNAGAGHIGNYDQCSFGTEGLGTFRGLENSQPYVGKKGELHQEEEMKLETIFPSHLQATIIQALLQNHPYEEVAYDIFPLENLNPQIGAGLIGELSEAMEEEAFFTLLKKNINTSCIKHTAFRNKKIKSIAICGGSGSFLIGKAKSANVDVFITGDIKYHDFFNADDKMIIADVGHYESEQFTKELIHDFLIEKFPKFAVQISEHQTNPIKYF